MKFLQREQKNYFELSQIPTNNAFADFCISHFDKNNEKSQE